MTLEIGEDGATGAVGVAVKVLVTLLHKIGLVFVTTLPQPTVLLVLGQTLTLRLVVLEADALVLVQVLMVSKNYNY